MTLPEIPHHVLTASELLEKVSDPVYASSSDLADAIGEVFSEFPKQIPSGFTPTDLILVGRTEGLLDFQADGVRITVKHEH